MGTIACRVTAITAAGEPFEQSGGELYYEEANNNHEVTSMSSGESNVYDANGYQTQYNIVRSGNYSLRYDADWLSGTGWLTPIEWHLSYPNPCGREKAIN
jgi:hypothetical protein